MKFEPYKLILSCGILLCAACAGGQGPHPVATEVREPEHPAGITAADTMFWYMWTPEQRKVNLQMGRVLAENLRIIDGQLVLDMPKEKFQQTGLPDSLYDQWVVGLRELCRSFDSIGPETALKEYERFMEDHRRIFGD